MYYLSVSNFVCIGFTFFCQTLPIVIGNDKAAILNALISSNNEIWQSFQVHPLTINMRLAQAAAAQARGGDVTIEEMEQLEFGRMLINISKNQDSDLCNVIEVVDEDVSTIGLTHVMYFTSQPEIEQVHDQLPTEIEQLDNQLPSHTVPNCSDVMEWLHPGGILDTNATILSSSNVNVDRWNATVQNLNLNEAHNMKSKDSFSEVDDEHGHIAKMLTIHTLNAFQKNGVPHHELILKVDDICIITRSIKCLRIANNMRVRILAIHTHIVEVCVVGREDAGEPPIRIPRIPFRFRLKYGESFQVTRIQFPLRLAYAMTFNKCQSQTLYKVLLDITTPPFAHGHVYVTMSRVRDCHKIRLFLNKDQLAPSTLSSTGYMPTVDNIVYQDVVALNLGFTPSDSTTPRNLTLPPPVVQQLQQRQTVNNIVHQDAPSDSTPRNRPLPSSVVQGRTQLRLNSLDNIGYVYVYIFIPIFLELSLIFIYSISKA
jgi:ATP-dependent DNA helicase PIF1